MLIGKSGGANVAANGKINIAEQHDRRIAAGAATLSAQIRPAKSPKI
jgi:hypothetical protein